MKNEITNTFLILLICLSNSSFSQIITIPIQFGGKLILLKGNANGEQGYFILDLGTSEVLLNKRYFKGKPNNDLEIYGANGIRSSLQTCIANISIGEMSWKGKEATVLSLRHLEEAKGTKILGLIGGKLFRSCELTIDFRSMKIHINKDCQPTRKSNHSFIVNAQEEVLPFKLKGGMPWVEANINGQIYKLGLDTAAEANLMDAKSRKKLRPWLSDEKVESLRGTSNQVRKVPTGKLGQLMVGSMPCRPMKTFFTDLSIINKNLAGTRLDGILGFEFLRQFKVAINFKAKEITLWPLEGMPEIWYPEQITKRDSLVKEPGKLPSYRQEKGPKDKMRKNN